MRNLWCKQPVEDELEQSQFDEPKYCGKPTRGGAPLCVGCTAAKAAANTPHLIWPQNEGMPQPEGVELVPA